MTEESVLRLEYSFVCFIDILGFSNMVEHDCGSPGGSEKFIERLYKANKNIIPPNKNEYNFQVIQFSDSVVMSAPYSCNCDKFEAFLNIISRFQYELFKEHILSRGGIAHGKHFSEGTFIFSKGLIEAYKLENIANYPRILVSEDLVELIYPGKVLPTKSLLKKESDDEFFVDFFQQGKPDECKEHLQTIVATSSFVELPSIKAKHQWLVDYYNFKFPAEKMQSTPRFI